MQKRLEKREDGVYLVLGAEKSRARYAITDALQGSYALEWAGYWRDSQRPQVEYRVRIRTGYERLSVKTYFDNLALVLAVVKDYNDNETAVDLIGETPDYIEIDDAVEELYKTLYERLDAIGKRIEERNEKMKAEQLRAAEADRLHAEEKVYGERTRADIHYEMTFGLASLQETARTKTLQEIHDCGGL